MDTLEYSNFIEKVSTDVINEINKNRYVLMIGKNGRGKSNILAMLAEKLAFQKKLVLALSFSITDKFPFSSKAYYQYLGVKSTSNSTHTNTIDNKIFENLLKGASIPGFEGRIAQICEFLETSYTLSIKGECLTGFAESSIDRYIARAVTARRGRSILDLESLETDLATQEAIDKILDKEDLQRDQIHLCLRALGAEEENTKFERHLELSDHDTIKAFSFIPKLRKLGIIRNFSLNIGNHQTGNLNFLSSGQKHIFFTLIQVCLYVGRKATLLIDEPEISLHPDWQARYIPLLEQLFGDEDFKYVIATHSPFVAINCSHLNTSIISLAKQDGMLTSERIDSMNGWSVDIASVDGFKVGSYRSIQLEKLLLQACEIIAADEPSKLEARAYIAKLKQYTLSPEDPVHSIIADLEEVAK
ncbi:AAA family ATPase [Pseudomonas sp. URIL14HWK12:I6]|uniref:AAA family ATPase n=1 Tax=Pseudomonas sp. URIL14HWK12:I6 TaxID=1283293 RepID=UPI00048891CF|nr:AAA family ATPase [Pseudomonas sp. URIL14HWK12:I6]